jgi:hypothetical protein
MAKPLTRAEVASLADTIGRFLVAIRGNELDASLAMTYRLEGALVALEAVLGEAGEALRVLTDRREL